MERKIGEVFNINGETFIVVEDNSDLCNDCCFWNNRCYAHNVGSCSRMDRSDSRSVIFRKVEDMEERTVKLTLEKAKEFYKKGGEFRDLALSAFTEEELTKVCLPKTWEKFCSQFNIREEYYIDADSSIEEANNGYRDPLYDKNILPSKKAAEQHRALMQLHQLRDCYRQGWKPNWLDDGNKYCIIYNSVHDYSISINKNTRVFLSFQSREIAQLFLDNFRNLIEEAGDLI